MDSKVFTVPQRGEDYPQLAHYKINCSQFFSSSINHPQISHDKNYAKAQETFFRSVFPELPFTE